MKFRSLSEDHARRIQKRVEMASRNALDRLRSLEAYLEKRGEPRTRRDFERLAIRFQVVSEAMQETPEQMR